MSDWEYDQLTDELASLERDTGLVLSGSPTQKVSGEILETLTEVRHTKPMLSAGKTKSVEDLVKFAAKRPVLLSWKMDGLTLVLRYESGELKQAITRGREGIVGEDVTHTVRTFLNVPLTVPTKDRSRSVVKALSLGPISIRSIPVLRNPIHIRATWHPAVCASSMPVSRRSAVWSFGHSSWSAIIWNRKASWGNRPSCRTTVFRCAVHLSGCAAQRTDDP